MDSNSAHAPGSGLVAFAGGGRPQPESAGRVLLIRSVAVAALLVNVAYVFWRATSTLDLGSWWASVPLLLLEVHAVVGLGLFAFSLWDVDALPPAPRRVLTDERVAVVIPTYNEPVEVLLPTVAAAVALRPAHETWVLDDGDRPEVRRLAERLGARYLARQEHVHAKAGNLNNALGVIDAELIAVLDADHVATPDFLTHTLAYFDDPRVAVVQTPQDFYNLDSFEHEALKNRDDDALYNEQALFYRVLQPGKNRWGAAFWCGTSAVVRTAALRDVGGVATETVTEDIHTTIRFHRLGWRTVYHNEVLARGLAAGDASQYSAQRLRWGTGAMQVLRTENPLWCRGLRLRQRLAYATTLLGWFDAWRSLGYLVLPVVVLLTGAVPIQADPWLFTAAFGASFVLQRIAILLLSRGRAPQLLTSVFELVRMPANLRATLTLLRRRERAFQVSPKGRVGDDRRRVAVPAVLWALLVASVVAGVAFALTLAGLTPINYEIRWAAYGAAGWLVLNTVLLIAAVCRIRAERFAGERRASVRFDLDLAGSLDGTACRVRDLSLTGARVVAPAGAAPPDGGALDVDGLPVRLRTVARSARPFDDGSVLLGLQFEPGQDAEQAILALALFNTRNVPRLVAPLDPPPIDAAVTPIAPLPVAITRVFAREPRPSAVDAVEPAIRELLGRFPRIPANVIAERIGWQRSMTVLEDRVRDLRPLFAPADPRQRTEYRPGELAQWDLWFPATKIPLGQAQEAILPVIVGVSGYSRHIVAGVIPSTEAQDLLGHLACVVDLGAVPRRGVQDDEAALVSRHNGRPDLTEALRRFRGTLGMGVAERLGEARAAMMSLPPVLPDPAWRETKRLGRDHLLSLLERHAPDPVTRQVARLALLEHTATADPALPVRLRAAVERRHDALVDTSGLNEEGFDSLVVLAAGSWEPQAIAAGY